MPPQSGLPNRGGYLPDFTVFNRLNQIFCADRISRDRFDDIVEKSGALHHACGMEKPCFLSLLGLGLRSASDQVSGVARDGGTLSLCMIQLSHRFDLAASSPNLSESILAGWAAVLGFAALTLRPFGLATRALTATRQTGFRQIWFLAAVQTGWLD